MRCETPGPERRTVSSTTTRAKASTRSAAAATPDPKTVSKTTAASQRARFIGSDGEPWGERSIRSRGHLGSHVVDGQKVLGTSNRIGATLSLLFDTVASNRIAPCRANHRRL